MKKILATVIFFMVIFVMSFPVCALTHDDLLGGIEMELPVDFVKVENSGSTVTVYTDYYGNFINFTTSYNSDKTSFSDLSYSELEAISTEYRGLFIPEGSLNEFISYPYAENVVVNGYKGVKIKASYIDGNTYQTVYSTVYLFSTERNICGVAFVSTESSGDIWYSESLDTIKINGKIYKDSSSASSSVNPGNAAYNIGKIAGIGIIAIPLIGLFFRKRK